MQFNSKKSIIISNTDGAQFKFRGELIKSLRSAGWHVTSVASIDSTEGAYSTQLTNIVDEAHSYPFMRQGFCGFVRTFFLLRSLLKREKFDVLHAYGHEAALLAIFNKKLLRDTRIFITYTGLGRFYSERSLNFKERCIRGIFNFIYRSAIDTIDKYIFLNDDDLRLLMDYCELPADRTMQICGEGFVPRYSREVVLSSSRAKDSIQKILFASRIMEEKGILELLDAMLIVERHSTIQLYVAGVVDPLLKDNAMVRDMIKGSLSNVTYLGFVDDIEPVLSDVDVVILPTKYKEGLPRILIEALSMGKYIVTTNAPGAKSTVISESNGVILSDVSPVAIADALLLIDEGKLKQAKLSSRLHFEKNYDSSLINKILVDLYESENEK